jgi:hypothetical protein
MPKKSKAEIFTCLKVYNGVALALFFPNWPFGADNCSVQPPYCGKVPIRDADSGTYFWLFDGPVGWRLRVHSDYGSIGIRLISGYFECTEFSGRLDRNDARPADTINDKIARSREHQSSHGSRNFVASSFVNSHIDILPDVGDIIFVAPVLPQELH